jgi:hypothetical protein
MAQPEVLPIPRSQWRSWLLLAWLALPLAANVSPSPVLGTALRFAQAAILLAGIAVYARHGIRRRRGVWTAQSWRRFAASIIVSLMCVAMMLTFAAGVDAGWSWVGAKHSALRLMQFLASTVAGLVGSGMFVGAMNKFAHDAPGSQYDSRLRWSRLSAQLRRGKPER